MGRSKQQLIRGYLSRMYRFEQFELLGLLIYTLDDELCKFAVALVWIVDGSDERSFKGVVNDGADRGHCVMCVISGIPVEELK